MFNKNIKYQEFLKNIIAQNIVHTETCDTLYSTECCRKMSGIFPIFHCNWNIVATFLLNIAKYFIATLWVQLSEIFFKTNKYLILVEIL